MKLLNSVKNNLKVLFSLCLSLSLISCQTITISPEGKPKLASNPDYEKTQHFFLGGLIGESVVPAGEICGERSVAQLQSQTTFLDGFWPVLVGLTVGVALGVFLGWFETIANGSPKEIAETSSLLGFSAAMASVIYTPKTAKVWCGEKVVVPAENNSEEQEAS